MIAAGIARAVIATPDPNPVAAGGVAMLRAAGLTVDVGAEAEAALELNAPFFHRFTSDRPWTTVKLALSSDGAIAAADRRPTWLTGEESRREVHRQRAAADAIAVGIGTVLADDPLLTVRDTAPPRVAPARVVFDRSARLPLTSRLMTSLGDAPVTVVTDGSAPERERSLERAGASVIRAAGTAEALRALRTGGVESLYVEGGAGLAGALLEARLVDRLIIFQAPVVLGGGSLAAFAGAASFASGGLSRFRIVRQAQFGPDEMTIYALH